MSIENKKPNGLSFTIAFTPYQPKDKNLNMSISGFSASLLAGYRRISERPQKPVPPCNNVMF
jgi:hypothetical protein